jgi:hypothetical protein
MQNYTLCQKKQVLKAELTNKVISNKQSQASFKLLTKNTQIDQPYIRCIFVCTNKY